MLADRLARMRWTALLAAMVVISVVLTWPKRPPQADMSAAQAGSGVACLGGSPPLSASSGPGGAPSPFASFHPNQWCRLDDGLEFAGFALPRRSSHGDSMVRMLRIDPARYELKLLCASARRPAQALTAAQWARQAGLVAAINAGMFKRDGRTGTGLMLTKGHVNNPRPNEDKALLAFDPVRSSLSPAVMADLEQEPLSRLSRGRYQTLIQGSRMIGAGRTNLWAQQGRKWSTAAIGQDGAGRILFILCRSPYSVHDLTEMLLGLNIDLQRCMYCEGGPETQLYIHSGQFTYNGFGSYETGFREDDANDKPWPAPNVVGIVKRQ